MRTNANLPATKWRKGILGVLLLVMSMFVAAPLSAQDAVPADQLKAAFLYNFARFVEWPASAFATESTPLTLGVFGTDDFTSTLATALKDKKAHNRSFVVKKLSAVSDAADCQIVFLASTEGRRAAQVADATKKKPVLLVGESDDFLNNGGMINIVQDEKQKQLRFDVSPKTAEEAGLTISSHLLRLARNTTKGGSK